MDMGEKRAGAVLVCAALVMSMGTGFAVSVSTAVPAPVSLYSAEKPDRDEFLNFLLNWTMTDHFVAHEPMEGQISRDQAIEIAMAAVPRLMRHLSINEYETSGMELTVVGAYLGQYRFQELEEIPLEPQFSFWSVFLSIPDEAVLAQIGVNAQMGAVIAAVLDNVRVDSSLEISADKLLSGFMDDLGLGAFEYGEASYTTAGALDGVEEVASQPIADGAALAMAAIYGDAHRVDGEPFGEYTNFNIELALIPPMVVSAMAED
jgi:hypothetical protein